MTKNHVETYSPSNAAAPGPEEKAQNHYKLKEELCSNSEADVKWQTSSRQGFNSPELSHNHPRTSNPWRQ